ncbi:penicillin-binding protein 2 [Alkanindiges sp. WGS2144]|uniref:penicillin-binding protein 2 n=1 Tax=Alkanindiges sp. WGS2144 TaxID=3366808 RepID=UPI0037521873
MKRPFPLKNPHQDQQIFRQRIWFAAALIVLGFVVLLSRYTYLQVFQYGQYHSASDKNRIRLQALPPARGYIYDRNGILLADNYPVFTAVVNRADIDDLDDTLKRLTPVLELTEDDLVKFRHRAKTTRKTESLAIKLNLNEQQIARFSELKYSFPGVSIDTKMTRFYPQGELFAHVIGYVGRINEKELGELDKEAYAGTDLIGKIGIEKYYEDLLHGKPGYQYIEADAHGQVLRHLGQTPAIRGNDLYLSLDYGLQTIAHEQLSGRRGAIVAMDPRTGEILAFVSNPSFNPNLFVTGISHKNYSELRDNPDQPLYNRALQGVYPPGSTIKPMEGLGGIHYGLINWSSQIYDPGYFHLPGDSHRFRDWKKSGHGTVNMDKAITWSCDTFFYVLAYRMGIENMHDWMTQFGFGSRTGIDLPNESSGLYPSPKWKMEKRKSKWLPGETISVSIGQGAFTATPIQLAMATAITANHGHHVTPHVLRESRGPKSYPVHNAPDGKVTFNGTEQDWINMRESMVNVIRAGTGGRLKIGLRGYEIAGKTGTAQVKSIAQGKRYNEAALDARHLDHGLFVGFAPADKPTIAIAVILENGKHGGAAALLSRPMFDYAVHQMEKNPLKPVQSIANGGLMTAGMKPQEISEQVSQSTSTANSTPAASAPTTINGEE